MKCGVSLAKIGPVLAARGRAVEEDCSGEDHGFGNNGVAKARSEVHQLDDRGVPAIALEGQVRLPCPRQVTPGEPVTDQVDTSRKVNYLARVRPDVLLNRLEDRRGVIMSAISPGPEILDVDDGFWSNDDHLEPLFQRILSVYSFFDHGHYRYTTTCSPSTVMTSAEAVPDKPVRKSVDSIFVAQ